MIQKISRTGALPCFCSDQAQKGFDDDTTYYIVVPNDTRPVQLCENQMKYAAMISAGTFVSFGGQILIVL